MVNCRTSFLSKFELAVNTTTIRLMAEASKVQMGTEGRREQLLRSGVELLAVRSHDEVSIEDIAEAAGVSKGLLYYYFPTKKDFILAALDRGRRQLAKRLRPDPKLDPEAQLDVILDAFLDYVEEHASAYITIFNWRGGDREIAAVLDAGRNEQLETVMGALQDWEESPFSKEPSAAQRAAVQGWLFFVEGAVLSWLENGGMERVELRRLLRLALGGSLWAAEASVAPLQNVSPP